MVPLTYYAIFINFMALIETFQKMSCSRIFVVQQGQFFFSPGPGAHLGVARDAFLSLYFSFLPSVVSVVVGIGFRFKPTLNFCSVLSLRFCKISRICDLEILSLFEFAKVGLVNKWVFSLILLIYYRSEWEVFYSTMRGINWYRGIIDGRSEKYLRPFLRVSLSTLPVAWH